MYRRNLAILFAFACLFAHGQSLKGQSLLWEQYVQSKLDSTISTLRDYSHAGYHKSEIGLPEISAATHTVFDVTDYGAIPNDGLSDRQAIVDAIADASQATPAIVYIPEGRFRINEPSDIGQPDIVIQADSLVLKGAGMARTELYADQSLLDQGSAFITFVSRRPNRYYYTGAPVRATVPVPPDNHGGYSLRVDQSNQLAPGMVIAIVANLNVNTPEGQKYFYPHDVPAGAILHNETFNKRISELHTIQSIQGNTVIFEEPIHLDLQFMEEIVLKELAYQIRESGIEDMTLTANHREQFKHHAGSTHSTKFNLLKFDYAYNCWANNIRYKDFTRAVSVVHSMYCTMANMRYEGNTGHIGSGVGRSYGILYAFQRENGHNPCHHGFGGQEHAANTVYYRAKQYQGIEAHGPFPHATLYDLNHGGFNTRGGGAMDYPSHGKGLCFWNWEVEIPGSEDFWPTGEPYGYFMPPVVAGLYGEPMTIDNINFDLEAHESLGAKILNPLSLFEAQLALRTGSVPPWLLEQANLYEKFSRPFWVQIKDNINHTFYDPGAEINLELLRDKHLILNSVTKIELLQGDSLFQDRFEVIAETDQWTSHLKTRIYSEGAHILRVRMTNHRGEVTESDPLTVYIRDSRRLTRHPIVRATSMSDWERRPLYRELTAQGGGETQYIVNSAFDGHDLLELYEIEELYRLQMDTFTQAFSDTYVKPILDSPIAISRAMKLIDSDPATTIPNVFAPITSFVQFDLGESKYIDAIDLVFNSIPPEVQLEVLVSNDDRAWYSLVNDEMSWEFGLARIGKNHILQPLPQNNNARIYIPKRHARYVRLILGNFPNNQLHTVNISGKAPATDEIVHQIPGTIEAEAYHDQTGLAVELTNDIDLGRHLTSIHQGDHVTYKVHVTESGKYNLSYRLAADSIPGTIVCFFDEDTLISFPNMVGSQKREWNTYTVQRYLEEGDHNIQLEFRSKQRGELLDLNYIEVWTEELGRIQPDISIYPNPTSLFLNISENASWTLFSTTGIQLAKGEGHRVILQDQKPGIYLLQVNDQVFKVIKY